MKNTTWLLPLLLTVASSIFGLFLAEWLEIVLAPRFSTEIRAVLSGLLIVGVIALIATVSVVFFSRRAELREEKWLSIEKHLGTQAEIDFEPIKIGEGKFYRRLADYVRNADANDEIVVVATYGAQYGKEHPQETEQYRAARELYSRALIEKSKQPGVIYRRIICFPETFKQGKIVPEIVKQMKRCSQLID
jgi:hypothetical protein